MTDEGPPMLVCVPVHNLDEPFPDSEQQWCIYCAAEVWVSPEGQRFAEREPRLRICCTECAIGLMADETNEPDVRIVPDSPLPPWAKRFMQIVMRHEIAAMRARKQGN